MPSVGRLLVIFVTSIALIALVGGIMGCLNAFLAPSVINTASAGAGAGGGALIGLSAGPLGALIGAGIGGGIGYIAATLAAGKTLCGLAFLAFTLSVSGWFLGMAALLFEFSLNVFVVQMGSLLSTGSSLAGVNFSASIGVGWKIVRDLMNFIFIIIIVYAAISMILGLKEHKPGPLIVKVLIAAILVNFSFLFGAVIVDVSNFVSKKIYDEAISIENYTPPSFSSFGEVFKSVTRIETAPVTGRFMQVTRLGSVYDWFKTLKESDPDNQDSSNLLLPFLLGGFGLILFSLTAGIFFVAGLFLIIRFVVIALLLMLAPIGMLYFVGLSPLSKWGKAWWDTLLAQALFPVTFLFMVGLSLKFVEEGLYSIVPKGASFSDLITYTGGGTGLNNNFNILLVFVVTWMLLYLSLQLAANLAQGKFDYVPPSPAALYKGAAQTQAFFGRLNPLIIRCIFDCFP